MANPRSESGFTLLEVMLVLVLVGFLMAALTEGIRFGLRAWDLQEVETGRIEALDTTDHALRNLIQHMETGENRADRKGLLATRDQLTFVSRLPAAVAAGRRAEMTLTLASGGRLVLRWRPFRHENGPSAEVQEVLLLDHVEKIDIAYWRMPAQGGQGGWASEWTQPGIPRLVRIRVVFPSSDRRHWPDIMVAPVIERQAG